jgi:hypothetical protein
MCSLDRVYNYQRASKEAYERDRSILFGPLGEGFPWCRGGDGENMTEERNGRRTGERR